jgi:hypothetical protein|tara:strand:+ start:3932 stop:4276 length:345 start_codon:yes stop_codon:yes gene_type:complete
MQKKLQKGSILAEELDTNGDGVVTDQELMLKERMMRLENQDKKEDQQRYMVWFSAISVTLFIVVLMLPVVPLDRVDHLSSIASTWVISNMGIIGAFIAGNAFSRKSGGGKNEPI